MWGDRIMQGELVSYQINGHSAQGYFVKPEGEARGGVVVIQEWWGLNDHIKDVAERVAELGYITIAPDLYDGKVAIEPDEAQKLRMEMILPEAVKKIKAAGRFLKEQGVSKAPAGAVEKVAVMGFCMGGTLTLLATTTGEFVTGIPFYGRITEDIQDSCSNIKVPILGIYGTHDHGIPVDSVNELKEVLDKNGVINEFHFYGVGHAFFNDTRESYDEKSAQESFEKVKAWLEKYLE